MKNLVSFCRHPSSDFEPVKWMCCFGEQRISVLKDQHFEAVIQCKLQEVDLKL